MECSKGKKATNDHRWTLLKCSSKYPRKITEGSAPQAKAQKRNVILNINQIGHEKRFFNITRKIQPSLTGSIFPATINIRVITLGPGNIVGSIIRPRWGLWRMKCVYRKCRIQYKWKRLYLCKIQDPQLDMDKTQYII